MAVSRHDSSQSHSTTKGDKMTDYIFEKCVVFLHWLARKLGTTYEAVNVWLFCVIWPLLTLFLMGWVVWLLMHRHPVPQ
jgi:hypothetical protein